MRPTKTALLTAAALASTSALTLPARAQVQGANFPQVTSPTMIGPPTATTFGGVLSNTPVTHQYVTGVNTSGVLTVAQPSASDITGLGALATENSLLCSQMPALTGGATTSAGACAVTLTPSSVASALSGQTISGLTALSVGAETVTGAASIGGGMAGVGGFSFDNVTVSGAASVTGAANLGATTIHGAGSVTGGFAVAGTITGAAGAFTGGISAASATITSATTIQGPLSVTGFTDTGTASVTGAATISGVTLPGGAAIAMAGTLSGFTTATGSSLNLSGSATISGNQTVTGGASFGGTIGGFTTLSGGAINITGAQTVGGALSVVGAATVTGAITAAGSSVIINGSGSVQKILEFTTSGVENWQFYEDATGSGSNLNVARYNSGGTLVDVPISINFSTGNIGLSQGLNVGANATVTGSVSAATLNTSSTATIGGAATVVGALNVEGVLNVNNNINGRTTGYNAGFSAGWNYTSGEGETDIFYGIDGGSTGGLNFYSVNTSGTATASGSPQVAFDTVGSIFAQGNVYAASISVSGGITSTGAATVGGALFVGGAAVTTNPIALFSNYPNSGAFAPPSVVIQNFNVGTGLAGIGFTSAQETSNPKAGIGLVRSAVNGVGTLFLYNSNNSANTNAFLASDTVAAFSPGGGVTFAGAVTAGGATFTNNAVVQYGSSFVLNASGNTSFNYLTTNGAGDLVIGVSGTVATGNFDVPGKLVVSGAATIGGSFSFPYSELAGNNYATQGETDFINIYNNVGSANIDFVFLDKGINPLVYINGKGAVSISGGASVAGGISATSGFITGTYSNVQPTGTTQGTAAAITSQITSLVTATSTAGVELPATSSAPAGSILAIYNATSVAQNIYPPSGGNINSGSSVSLAASATMFFINTGSAGYYVTH